MLNPFADLSEIRAVSEDDFHRFQDPLKKYIVSSKGPDANDIVNALLTGNTEPLDFVSFIYEFGRWSAYVAIVGSRRRHFIEFRTPLTDEEKQTILSQSSDWFIANYATSEQTTTDEYRLFRWLQETAIKSMVVLPQESLVRDDELRPISEYVANKEVTVILN